MAGRSSEEFTSDEASFDAVLFNLQIIGEAIKRFPDAAREALPGKMRSGPAKLRDLIAHHYFAVDPDIIWEVATTHVPALLAEARAVRDRVDGEAGGG